MKYLLALDQGTTSSRAILFNEKGELYKQAQYSFPQHFPEKGWVEHNPIDIWQSSLTALKEAIVGVELEHILALGITNQRETTILWDKMTGEPVYNAIVWQDRRTAKQCLELKQQGHEKWFRNKTGLLLDPYFSATKIAWLLEHIACCKKLIKENRLAFGTVDSYLLWQLTAGKVHATDVTNASRTALFNIHTAEWDQELLDFFGIPASILPSVFPCDAHFGEVELPLLGRDLPITGMAGDQHAATIGQACIYPGMVKSTYGTGCFVLANTGEYCVSSQSLLLSTIAYEIKNTRHYALEGSIFIAGAVVQWLRDVLGIVKTSEETEELAVSLDSNHGIYFVPSFTGLGAPYWQPEVQGALFGIARDTKPSHIVRAALEAIAYQTRDLFIALEQEGIACEKVRVDGGMTKNTWLMQFLSDCLGLTVERSATLETTAKGVAMIAGIGVGLYPSLEDAIKLWESDQIYFPTMSDNLRENLYTQWQRAVGSVCYFHHVL